MDIMRKKAVIFGGGNIGRGFVGAKLAQAGYEVIYIDVNQSLVEEINRRRRYPLRIVEKTRCDRWIEGVRAVSGTDVSAITAEIAAADLMASAVGAAALPKITPAIALGLQRRWEKDPGSALDILICENMNHADTYIHNLIKQELSEKWHRHLDEKLGLVECSIGCMVPVMTPEMQDGDPLRICVEAYDFLPIDRDAFKNELPEGERWEPFSPFSYYVQRKLFIHNMGHAMTAYLGRLQGIQTIWQAIEKPEIRLLVQNAMTESALALSLAYQQPYRLLQDHIDDLLLRFGNSDLGDTVDRVGRDPLRKLGKDDRLAGAAAFCLSQNVAPVYISVGLAAALLALGDDEKARIVLEKTSNIPCASDLGQDILACYGDLQQKQAFPVMMRRLEERKRDYRGSVV